MGPVCAGVRARLQRPLEISDDSRRDGIGTIFRLFAIILACSVVEGFLAWSGRDPGDHAV